jgi:4-hydroxy-3-polyprenylbenzoate decarboxylase
MDDLENASDLPAYGGKMGVDATRKWASEGFTREWPTRVTTTEQAGRRAAHLWARIAQGWKPTGEGGAR